LLSLGVAAVVVQDQLRRNALALAVVVLVGSVLEQDFL
jgi:hypothetical protein